MGKRPLLTHSKVGKDGRNPSDVGLNCRIDWWHVGNKQHYMVTGFRWDAERDIWMVEYTDGVPGNNFARSIPNFLERMKPEAPNEIPEGTQS